MLVRTVPGPGVQLLLEWLCAWASLVNQWGLNAILGHKLPMLLHWQGQARRRDLLSGGFLGGLALLVTREVGLNVGDEILEGFREVLHDGKWSEAAVGRGLDFRLPDETNPIPIRFP